MGITQQFTKQAYAQNIGYETKNVQVKNFIQNHLEMKNAIRGNYFAYVLKLTDLYSIFILWIIGTKHNLIFG